jgi:beta-glucosidase
MAGRPKLPVQNDCTMRMIVIACFLLSATPWVHAQQNTSKKAAELVSNMTLEEKARLVVGMGMKLPGMPATNNGPTVGVTMDKVPGAAGTTFAIPRLGIKTTVVADGPAGVRIEPYRNGDSSVNYFCTAFPIATLIASSWDVQLAQSIGAAMGSELKSYGMDVLLAPALNIHRNPLGGRNFEYFSEDPVVSGYMAAAVTNGIESNGVGTSIKHFAANNQETNRNQVNTIVSERALREIYLRGFEIAVKKAQPWTVMSSYNRINGVSTSESYDLLTTILRKEWGFKGLVMTDWFGGYDAVAQMKAGNDLLMPGTPDQTKKIQKAVETGLLDVKILDENATRIVEYILKSPSQQGYAFNNKPNLKAHAAIARQAAAEGMVLLQNNNAALPLPASVKKIAAFGNTSYDFIAGGTGSGDVNEAYTVSLAQGLSNAGYLLDNDLQKNYSAFIAAEKSKLPPKKFFFELPPPIAEMEVADELLAAKAASCDVAFVTIGRNAGEFQDRKEADDFELTAAEKTLLQKVARAFHSQGKKMIVILNIGGIVETASWRNEADAILLAWQGGQEGGNAVADILKGTVNPSGKLTSSFPIKYTDVPSAQNFPGIELKERAKIGPLGMPMGKASEVVYEEGIYVGYRYFQTFDKPVAFPFGFGLSYSNFQISNLKLNSATFNGKLSATVTVTNTGKVAGKEVVQLYLSAPTGQLHKPSMELKAFGKTNMLKPGESQTLSFALLPKDLASFDTGQTAWIAEKGTYTLQAGSAINALTQQASFELPQTLLVEKCNKVLVPERAINELQPNR